MLTNNQVAWSKFVRANRQRITLLSLIPVIAFFVILYHVAAGGPITTDTDVTVKEIAGKSKAELKHTGSVKKAVENVAKNLKKGKEMKRESNMNETAEMKTESGSEDEISFQKQTDEEFSNDLNSGIKNEIVAIKNQRFKDSSDAINDPVTDIADEDDTRKTGKAIIKDISKKKSEEHSTNTKLDSSQVLWSKWNKTTTTEEPTEVKKTNKTPLGAQKAHLENILSNKKKAVSADYFASDLSETYLKAQGIQKKTEEKIDNIDIGTAVEDGATGQNAEGTENTDREKDKYEEEQKGEKTKNENDEEDEEDDEEKPTIDEIVNEAEAAEKQEYEDSGTETDEEKAEKKYSGNNSDGAEKTEKTDSANNSDGTEKEENEGDEIGEDEKPDTEDSGKDAENEVETENGKNEVKTRDTTEEETNTEDRANKSENNNDSVKHEENSENSENTETGEESTKTEDDTETVEKENNGDNGVGEYGTDQLEKTKNKQVTEKKEEDTETAEIEEESVRGAGGTDNDEEILQSPEKSDNTKKVMMTQMIQRMKKRTSKTKRKVNENWWMKSV